MILVDIFPAHNRIRIAASCLALGFALVVTSIGLKYFVLPNIPARVVWSREDAKDYTKAAMTFHQTTFDESASEEELAATAEAYRSHQVTFDAAISKYERLPMVFQLSGIAFVIVGAALYLAAKVAEEA